MARQSADSSLGPATAEFRSLGIPTCWRFRHRILPRRLSADLDLPALAPERCRDKPGLHLSWCFNPEHGLPLDAELVLGILSSIFWVLIIVVAVKYVLLIMRADNQGEGGILALLALVQVNKLIAARQIVVVLQDPSLQGPTT